MIVATKFHFRMEIRWMCVMCALCMYPFTADILGWWVLLFSGELSCYSFNICNINDDDA